MKRVLLGTLLLALGIGAGQAKAERLADNGQIAVVVGENGKLWGWGDDRQGLLDGYGGGEVAFPILLPFLQDARSVVLDEKQVLALRGDGTVWRWGAKSVIEAKRQGRNIALTVQPVAVVGLDEAVAIASGDGFGLALKRDGTVWRWESATPHRIAVLSDMKSIAASGDMGVALRRDGSVWYWDAAVVPTVLAGLSGIATITVDRQGLLAVGADGALWRWPAVATPRFVDGRATAAVRVAGFPSVSLAARDGDRLYAVARDDGALWVETSVDRQANRLNAPFGVTALSVSSRGLLAATASGDVYRWESGGDSPSPVLMAGPGNQGTLNLAQENAMTDASSNCVGSLRWPLVEMPCLRFNGQDYRAVLQHFRDWGYYRYFRLEDLR